MPKHRPHVRIFNDAENGRCIELIGVTRMHRQHIDKVNALVAELEKGGVEIIEVK